MDINKIIMTNKFDELKKGLYSYIGEVSKVIDGDTMDINVDLGFKIYTQNRFRIGNYTFDAPESFHPRNELEHIHGLKAKAFATELLQDKKVIIHTYKLDIYGRWSCDITLPDGRDFVTVMKENGFQKNDDLYKIDNL